MNSEVNHSYLIGEHDGADFFDSAQFELPNLEDDLPVTSARAQSNRADESSLGRVGGFPGQPSDHQRRQYSSPQRDLFAFDQASNISNPRPQNLKRSDPVGAMIKDLREIRKRASPLSTISRHLESRVSEMNERMVLRFKEQEDRFQQRLQPFSSLEDIVRGLREEMNVIQDQHATVLQMAQESVRMIRELYDIESSVPEDTR